MREFLFVTALMMLTTACAPTPATIRTFAPDAVYTSKKKAHEVAACIANKWKINDVLGGGLTVSSLQTENVCTVSLQIHNKLHFLVDIEDEEGGSSTKFYKYMTLSLGKDRKIEIVKECQ